MRPTEGGMYEGYTSWKRKRESLPNGDLFFAGLAGVGRIPW